MENSQSNVRGRAAEDVPWLDGAILFSRSIVSGVKSCPFCAPLCFSSPAREFPTMVGLVAGDFSRLLIMENSQSMARSVIAAGSTSFEGENSFFAPKVACFVLFSV